MNTSFITEKDLLSPSHFPVQVAFNECCRWGFNEFLRLLSTDTGWGCDEGSCTFWNDLDDYDRSHTAPYEGAEFSALDDPDVILSYAEIYYYMKIACRRYVEDHHDQKESIDRILQTYARRHHLS